MDKQSRLTNCIPEFVLQRRALREASEVLANALCKEAKERATSECGDRDVGRNSPPATSSVPIGSNTCDSQVLYNLPGKQVASQRETRSSRRACQEEPSPKESHNWHNGLLVEPV